MNLYIVMNDEGTYLVNLSKDNEEVFKEKGWKVLLIGLAHPDVMPGVLGNITLDPKFIAYKDRVKL